MLTMPRVLENINGDNQLLDLRDRAFIKHRRVEISGEINEEIARVVRNQLEFLSEVSEDDIYLIINSQGGNIKDALAIYDTMQHISCNVVTIGWGMAASAGAFLLAMGTPGKRYVTPFTEVMIHQPLGGVKGQATDIMTVAKHIGKLKNKLAMLMANACHKDLDEIMQDMERDYWLDATEAVSYGLADFEGFPPEY